MPPVVVKTKGVIIIIIIIIIIMKIHSCNGLYYLIIFNFYPGNPLALAVFSGALQMIK